MKRKTKKSGRYAYEGLDRVLHEKARLGILTLLATRPEGALFTELKELCSLTDGNLSRHLQTLEEAGLIEVWKGFRNRRPQTLVRLSKDGQERFLTYIAELQKVIEDAAAAKKALGKSKTPREGEIPEGWLPA
jgi:DNA-binding MarR family transcriptional regulator